MKNKILMAALGLFCTAPVAMAAHVADHLVISEVGVAAPSGTSSAPNSAEFIEIYNPTDTAVDLSNYFITDYTRYYELPAIVAGFTSNLLTNDSDFMHQFPAGAVLQPGQVAVVTNGGTKFLELYFGGDYSAYTSQPGSPLLFETNDTSSAIPNMGTNYNIGTAAGSNNIGNTDAGEFVVLFYWDGAGAYVKDVDAMAWRPNNSPWGGSNENAFPIKSGYPAAGPNGEFGAYATDLGGYDAGGGVTNLDLNYDSSRTGHAVRRSIVEAGEIHVAPTPGDPMPTNGYTNQDESMELINLTFYMTWGYPQAASPGITQLGRSSQPQAPVIGKARRDVKNPAPGTNVTITADIYGTPGFTAQLMVKKGAGAWTAQNMTAAGGNTYSAVISTAGLAEGTVVRWYVKAKNGTAESTEADFQDSTSTFPGNHNFLVKSTPYTPADLLVTEVMYDPKGANNTDHSQYLEVYNPGNQPLDLGGFYWGSSYKEKDDLEYPLVRFPDTFILPAKGYGVVAGIGAKLRRNYPGMDLGRIADVNRQTTGSVMAHAGATFYFLDCNQFDFDDQPVVVADQAFKSFSYKNNTEGWPNGSSSASFPTNAGNKGYSIELKNLTLADEGTGSSWAVSPIYNGTPMAPNAVDKTSRPGDVLVQNVERDVEFPGPGQPIVITATVESSTPISNMRVMVNTGSGTYTPIAMTLQSGSANSYTGTLPGYPDNTLVKYYVEATDTANNKGTYPFAAPTNIIPFRVDAVPSLANDLAITEIMFDPYGSDNVNFPEYVEVYNKSNRTIDLSFYLLGYTANTSIDVLANNTFPEGTIIGPGEYVTMVAVTENYRRQYITGFPSAMDRFGPLHTQYYSFGYDNVSKFPNGVGEVHFLHPNQIRFYKADQTAPDIIPASPSAPFIRVNYDNKAPWPNIGGAALNKLSIELKHPSLDPTLPENWGLTMTERGTPGRRNSWFVPPPSNVGNWTLY